MVLNLFKNLTLILFLLSNVNFFSQGVLTRLGDNKTLKIDSLKPKFEKPVIIINDVVYEIPDQCLESRKIGGAIENRKIGGDVENRKIGGAIENRKIGGDIENRKIGGAIENRKIGGDIENRKIGGATENRKIRGDISIIKCQKLSNERGFILNGVSFNTIIKLYYQQNITAIQGLKVNY